MGVITEVKEADSGELPPSLDKSKETDDAIASETSKQPEKEETCEESDKKTESKAENSCNGTIKQKESVSQSKVISSIPDKALLPSTEDDDDDEDEDESVIERLMGLGEMFPESLRNGVCVLSSSSLSFIKGAYSLTRKAVWLGVSTSVILFAPVMFELERYNVEEMVKQDRNRLVLGPGSAMSGSPGMAPPPSR